MIHSVTANQPSFNTVRFEPGFNVVLADRTKESTKKDSRNGLGKSTLIEIIHFCLGASARKNQGLVVEALRDWVFSLDVTLGGKRVTVRRSVADPSRIELVGDVGTWPVEREDGQPVLKIREWRALLGNLLLGLPPEGHGEEYAPSFRSVISYFVRRGRDAYSSPFEHYRKQLLWDRQVNNAFLLGLAWEDSSALQRLKDKEKALKDLAKAAKTGVVEKLFGTVGELEAEKVRLEAQTRRHKESLTSFRVHPQYREIEERSNELTLAIHETSNENVAARQMLSHYQTAITEVPEPEPEEVTRVYEEAGVTLPGVVRRRLEEVQSFHQTLIRNRKSYLTSEIGRIEHEISQREDKIRSLSDERSELLEILRTHGAFEEYSRLQDLHTAIVSQLEEVEIRLRNLKQLEEGRSTLKIEQELLQQRARRDYEERRAQRERAIRFFNENSQALYQAPGKLIIDVGPGGFRFQVEIERSGAEGIESMKIFCYDLMLAQLWSDKSHSPGFLIHDSTLFSGVDERQVAIALERAAAVAEEHGLQYICTLNSDTLPYDEFSEGFDIEQYVRLRLTDTDVSGSLLGKRF